MISMEHEVGGLYYLDFAPVSHHEHFSPRYLLFSGILDLVIRLCPR